MPDQARSIGSRAPTVLNRSHSEAAVGRRSWAPPTATSSRCPHHRRRTSQRGASRALTPTSTGRRTPPAPGRRLWASFRVPIDRLPSIAVWRETGCGSDVRLAADVDIGVAVRAANRPRTRSKLTNPRLDISLQYDPARPHFCPKSLKCGPHAHPQEVSQGNEFGNYGSNAINGENSRCTAGKIPEGSLGRVDARVR